jgi:aminomethyltransferase
VQGPRAFEVVAAICDTDLSELAYYRFVPREVRVGGAPCIVSRSAYSGERAYELFCAADAAPAVAEAVLAQGARPFGLAALEPHRIESGLLFVGRDYESGVSVPFELNLDRFVKLDAGDFIGRDAIRAQGEPARRLATLILDGEALPELGATVRRGESPVGVLTSVCASPMFERVIGLASLDVAFTAPGTELTVEFDGGAPARAVAQPHPYFDPERRRPRGEAV